MTQPYEQNAPSTAVVQLTLGQVYEKVQQTHDAVRTLTSHIEPLQTQVADHETRLRTVDGLPDDFKELKETVGKNHDAHETRLSKLENKIAMYAGASAVLGTAAGYLASWAIYHH